MTGSRGSRHIGQEAEHFVRLPLSLLASGLSVSAKLLLGLLEWHRNKRTNRCNPKLETLAAEFGVSKRTARRALAELRETGFVIEQRHGRRRDSYTLAPVLEWPNLSALKTSREDTNGRFSVAKNGRSAPPVSINEEKMGTEKVEDNREHHDSSGVMETSDANGSGSASAGDLSHCSGKRSSVAEYH